MTDKQIIIDGYSLKDLKNLLFTGQKSAISTKTFEAVIEELERKEQECEKWKKLAETEQLQEELTISIQENEKDTEINADLKAENDSLKSELMQTNCYLEADKEIIDQLKEENEKLKVWKSITPLKTKMLVKALTEIKEIADLSIAHFDIDYLKQAINEILQKCEVLNDR